MPPVVQTPQPHAQTGKAPSVPDRLLITAGAQTAPDWFPRTNRPNKLRSLSVLARTCRAFDDAESGYHVVSFHLDWIQGILFARRSGILHSSLKCSAAPS